jgi:beta-lactam-binding protein with PASTA domain
MSLIRFIFSRIFLKQFFLMLLLLFVVIYSLLFWLDSNTRHGQQIAVPDVSGMTLEEAQAALGERQLAFAILDTSSYNPNYPYQTVIEQIPASGALVKQERKIYLSINRSGYKMTVIPYIVGKTLRQAEPALRSAGFKVGKLTYKKYIAEDEVLSMTFRNRSLKQGDQLPLTSIIDLELGDGTGGFKVEALDRDSPYHASNRKRDSP